MSIGLVPVHADSADPVLPFHASVNVVNNHPVLTLDGGWQWTTHNSNCNLNRYAVGYAVDWNDSTTPGNLVGTLKSGQSVDVGTPTDNKVHFNHLASDTASGADPGDPNSTNDPKPSATRCGTYNASLGYNTGTWGPISHTYPVGTTTFNTCVVTYDMHLSGSGLQSGDDIAGGNKHNSDNSVESNNNTPLGNQCFTFFVPTITTHSSPASVVSGVGFADTATLSGVDPAHAPTGTITFTLHSALGNDPNGCGATVSGGPYVVSVTKQSSNPDVYGAVSPTVNPGTPGTYYWQASYSGDSHNAQVDGKCSDPNESTTITLAQPTIATQVSDSQVLVGKAVTDTATLSAVNPTAAPTGTIDFKVYSSTSASGNHCGTLLTDLGTVSVTKQSSSPDVYGAVSPQYTPTADGDVYWLASYSGDSNNLSATGACTDNNEHTTVAKATPNIPTSASNTNLKVGDSIHDTAHLTGVNPNAAPTGTITFTLYTGLTNTGNGCASQVAGYTADVEQVVKLSSNPDVYGAVSTSFTTTAATNYYWLAVYSGDTGNAGVSGNCNDAGETSSPGLTQPTIATVATANATVPGPMTDTATLGSVNPNANPTGTITFTLYSTLDANSPTGCGVVAAGPDTVSVGALVGGGFGATSPSENVSTVGTYYWLAAYSGDALNASVSGHCGDANESTVVAQATPGIVTQVSAASSPVGTPITDTATVSGGFNPTGTVTFTIFTDSGCSTEVNPAFVSTATLVAGSATSDPYTPTTAQQLYWGAVYNGDANNKSVEEACTALHEQTDVQPLNPTLSTSATPLIAIPDPVLGGPAGQIQDVATLHGATPDASGTVTFELFGPSATSTPNCSDLVTTVTGTVNSGQAVSPVVPITQAGYYFWRASYSGDGNNAAVPLTACGDTDETTHVTIPDLGLVKSALTNGTDPTSPLVLPGQRIDYTVSIPNSGNADVDDATVTDTLPAYVDIIPGSISNGGVFTHGAHLSVSAGTIVWNSVDILAHTTKKLTYSVTVDDSVPQGEVLTNLVQLGTLSARTHHQVPSGDLTVVKEVNKTTANYGDTLTYTLHVTAHGNLDEHNVQVSDRIPGYDPGHVSSGNTTYVPGSADCSGSGTCVTHYDSSTHTVSWNIGTLAAGDTRNVTFKVTIDTPRGAADGSIPHERIDNAAIAHSRENPGSVPSNVVHTSVNAVLGEKFHRPKKVRVLPFTGAPIEDLTLLGVTLLSIGATLSTVRRRRRSLGTPGPTDLA